jgi:hypothetical protein
MTDLKVVYADKHESRPDYKNIAWVEYNALQWLDEAGGRTIKSNALPLSAHIAPAQMRIDLLFSEESQTMPKRLYMLAVSKSLIPSVMPAPLLGAHSDEKGLLVTIQGHPDNPQAMRDFLSSSEMREILPSDAISLMIGAQA